MARATARRCTCASMPATSRTSAASSTPRSPGCAVAEPGAITAARTMARGWSSTRPADLLEHILRARRDRRAGTIDALDAGVVQELVVATRNHAADEDDDVAPALRLQGRDHRGHQGLVPGRERRHANRMDVVLDRLARALVGGL